MNMDRQQLLQAFQLKPSVNYHEQSIKRLAQTNMTGFRDAAVLIGIVERPSGLNVILTKRAAHLRHHPGQVSFPGGKYEESDNSIVFTALREAEEEIGIKMDQVHVFGQLPKLPTISKFNVIPVIAFVDADYQAKIDPDEVELAFEVPITHLLNPNKLFSAHFQLQQSSHRVFAIPYNEHFIWGVTAQIIESLQRHLVL